MILVYGDESMDETQQRVCALAIVAGREQDWQQIEQKWITRNADVPFHANDCDSDQGAYVHKPHAQNKELYRDLTIILADSLLGGFGVAFDLAAQRRIFPESLNLAYYSAFMRVMEAAKNCALNNQEISELTFDSRMESDHNAAFLYGSLRENEPEWAPYLAHKVSFDFSNGPRIQIADLFAREAMKALDNVVGPVKRKIRKSWKALKDTGRFHVNAYSDDWFNDLKRNIPELEKKLRIDKMSYIRWLQERERQHNMSNMLRFVDWTAQRDKGI